MEPESSVVLNLLQNTLRDLVNAIHDECLVPHGARSETPTELWAVLEFMRSTLQHAWTSKSDGTEGILLILALASRDQRLRRLFGGYFDDTAHPEDSILAYVLDPILKDHTNFIKSKLLENTLRFVANCVADTNDNRRLALRKNAVKNLSISLEKRECLPYVIPALYNLCVEYEDLDNGVDETASKPARVNAAQIELAHSGPDVGIIPLLFGVLNDISEEYHNRTGLLADLIDMASQTAPDDLLCLGVSSDIDTAKRRELLHQGLLSFLGPEAKSLMSRDADSAATLCGALVNVLTVKEIKQILLSERQMQGLSDFNHIICKHIQNLAEDEDEVDTVSNLKACEKALLQEFYTLSGLPEFPQTYTLEPHPSTHLESTKDSDFIQACIERPRNSKFYAYDPNPSTPSLAIAYAVLANLTTTEETAVTLVSKYRVHEPLQSVLQDVSDVGTLYPALGLLARLALPKANREEIVNCGMVEALRRFFRPSNSDEMKDWKSSLRIEAITALRRLISGQLRILSSLYEDAGPGSYLEDILDLFTACSDSSTKLEVGRLCVEHFRTVSITPEQMRTDSKLYDRMLVTNDLAGPIAFLCCEGQSPGAKAEGWFGLGLMTFWERNRQQVLEVLKTTRMVEEVEKVSHAVPPSDMASADNLKLILSRLDIEQGNADVDRPIREVFATARRKLGLGEPSR